MVLSAGNGNTGQIGIVHRQSVPFAQAAYSSEQLRGGIWSQHVGCHQSTVSHDHISSKWMDNNEWFVIICSEKYIFYDEKRAREAIIDDHQDGITYLANQIARSWFLNAIAPASGWLSDGFAKYLEYLITAPVIRVYFLFQTWHINMRLTLNRSCPTGGC